MFVESYMNKLNNNLLELREIVCCYHLPDNSGMPSASHNALLMPHVPWHAF